MPLPEPVANIADRIVNYYATKATPPFLIYQYEPKDEYAVRRELDDLRRWLEADPRNIDCDTVSLAAVFWETLEEGGQLGEIITLERAGAYEEAHLAVRQVFVAYRLHQSGESSRGLLTTPVWKRWLLDSTRIDQHMHRLAAQGLLYYARAGSSLRIDWRAESLVEVAGAVA